VKFDQVTPCLKIIINYSDRETYVKKFTLAIAFAIKLRNDSRYNVLTRKDPNKKYISGKSF
jgi:hypothetical protein